MHTADQDLPTLRDTGAPVRLVTVILTGEPGRACVVVTSAASQAVPRSCVDLDLDLAE